MDVFNVLQLKKEYRTRNKECPILKFKGMLNKEEGMSNIEVLACVISTFVVLNSFNTQNSLFNIRDSLRLRHSKFLVQYSLFPFLDPKNR